MIGRFLQRRSHECCAPPARSRDPDEGQRKPRARCPRARPRRANPRHAQSLARASGGQPTVAALSEVTGLDLRRLGTTADADEIKDTAVTQPLIVALGVVVARASSTLRIQHRRRRA